MLRACLLGATVLLVASSAVAQQHGHSTPAANEPASTKAYREAMMTMDRGMAITYSGDADKDFVNGMIAHHQGAIDMADVVLKTGDNAEAKKMAEKTKREQGQEIAEMKDWLKKNAAKEGSK